MSTTPTQKLIDAICDRISREMSLTCGGVSWNERTAIRKAISDALADSVVAVYTPADIEHVMDGIFVPAWREDYSPNWRMETLDEIVHSSEMRQAFEQIAGDIIYRKLGIT